MIDEAERRRVVDALPWPNVRGKRCLDIGAADRCLAEELEQRGAAEVVAVGRARIDEVYDLDPADVGTFDIVVSDGVLSQLHEPARALEAIHRVTVGMLLSAEPIELWPSVLGRGKPMITPRGDGDGRPGITLNGAGHKHLLESAGFTVERVSKPYTTPTDQAPELAPRWRAWVDALGLRAVTGSWKAGTLHRALLARRRD